MGKNAYKKKSTMKNDQSILVISLPRMVDNRGYNSILLDKDITVQLPDDFYIVQIKQGFSIKPYTLRGLHYQEGTYAQAKLCYALTGSVFNVALNLATGEVHTATLTPGYAMFIPKGYAHGYLTLEPNTLFQWCMDNDYAPEAARIVRYDSCGINWPDGDYIISEKDQNGELWHGRPK